MSDDDRQMIDENYVATINAIVRFRAGARAALDMIEEIPVAGWEDEHFRATLERAAAQVIPGRPMGNWPRSAEPRPNRTEVAAEALFLQENNETVVTWKMIVKDFPRMTERYRLAATAALAAVDKLED